MAAGIFESAGSEPFREDMLKWGAAILQLADALVVATRTDEQKVRDLCDEILTARGRDLQKFLDDFQSDPATEALLFCDVPAGEGELSTRLVSIVPQSILDEPVSAETALTYPTLRIGFTVLNGDRP